MTSTLRSSLRFAAVAFGLALALGLLGSFARPLAAGDAASPAVKLESLNFDAFKARLPLPAGSKQKYTVVDAWSTTCGPCMENFPHLVEMHKKYGPKGLRVVSLSLDDPSDKKAVASAEKFLKSKQAEFLNVLLDEEFGVGFDRLNINAIPAVFLYGPDGKEVKRFTLDDVDNQFTYDDVEKEIARLLGK